MRLTFWVLTAFALVGNTCRADAVESDEAKKIRKLLHPTSQYPQLNVNPTPTTQLILRFANRTEVNKYHPPKGFRVIRIWDENMVVASQAPLSEALVRELKSVLPKPRRIDVDARLELNQTISENPCYTTSEIASTGLKKDIDQVSKSLKGCSFSKKCDQSGAALDWDMKVSNLDLMLKEIQRLRLPPSTTQVAVLDSPIDISAAGKISANIDWERQLLFFKKNHDEVGHGTFVASRIAQVAPGVSLKSIPIFDKNGAGDSSSFEEYALKACDSGTELINLSGGVSTFFGIVNMPLDMVSPELHNKLASKGCLFIQSAGNEGEQGDVYAKIIPRKTLTVSSVDFTGEKSNFSSQGKIAAPGGMVPGYLVNQSGIGKSVTNQRDYSCGKDVSFLSGTSFSAPTLTGVAKWVLDISKTNPEFSKLAPADRVNLVENTLLASVGPGQIVDGFKAVIIAEEIAKAKINPGAEMGLQELSRHPERILERDERILKIRSQASLTPACSELKTCSEASECLNRNRTAVSLMSRADPSQSKIATDVFKTYHENGEFELAAFWKNQIADKKVEQDLNWNRINERVTDLGSLNQIVLYFSRFERAPAEVGDKLEEALWNQIRQKTNPREEADGRLVYFRNVINSLAKKGRGRSLLSKVLSQPSENLTDESLALGVYAMIKQSEADPSQMANSNELIQALNHPSSGKITKAFFIEGLPHLSEKVSTLVVEQALADKAINTDRLSVLLENIADSNLSATEKQKFYNRIMTSSRSSERLLMGAITQLRKYFPDENERRSSLQDLIENVENLKNEQFKKAIFGLSFKSMRSFSSKVGLDLFEKYLEHPLANAEARTIFGATYSDQLTSQDLLRFYSILSRSKNGFKSLPMQDLEAFAFTNDERLTAQQKYQVLREIGPKGLPPKSVMAYHLSGSRYSEQDQKMILLAYENH